MTTARIPVLLGRDDLQALITLLDAAGAEQHPRAEHLRSTIVSAHAQAGNPSYSYRVCGPWGSDSSPSEAAARHGVDKARAEHWAAGHGRDRRYHEIRAVRSSHYSFEDGSEYTGADVTLDVPDIVLSHKDEVESQRRCAAAQARVTALHEELRRRTGLYDGPR